MEKAKLCEQELKRKDEYNSLLVQVQAIKDKNLPPEKWTSTQFHTMIKWYRRPEDAAIPSKKADKLTHYFEICGRGDPTEPSLALAAETDNSMAINLPVPVDDGMLPEIDEISNAGLDVAIEGV